jgi:hypothetical protein
MDAGRFDTYTRTIARRMSRRGAVVTGSVGLGAALMSRLAPAAIAQDATPVVEEAGGDVQVLFVQAFGSATIVPGSGSAGEFSITLEGGTGQTVYFSDRPDRLVGTLSDRQFLDGHAFDPADPPNAAIVTLAGDGEDILVVELFSPTLDTASGAVTYSARVLDGQPDGAALASLAGRQGDSTIGETLGPTTLFIDQLTCGPDGSSCNDDSDCCSGYCCESSTTACVYGLCAG